MQTYKEEEQMDSESDVFLRAKEALDLNKTPVFQRAVEDMQKDLFMDFIDCDDPDYLVTLQHKVHLFQDLVNKLNTYVEEGERLKLEQEEDFQ